MSLNINNSHSFPSLRTSQPVILNWQTVAAFRQTQFWMEYSLQVLKKLLRFSNLFLVRTKNEDWEQELLWRTEEYFTEVRWHYAYVLCTVVCFCLLLHLFFFCLGILALWHLLLSQKSFANLLLIHIFQLYLWWCVEVHLFSSTGEKVVL